jgi:hypothetical protein
MKQTLSVLVLMTAVFAFSCSKDNGTNNNTTDCSGAAKSFATDVLPAMQTYCSMNSSCHGVGSVQGPGALTTYGQISANKQSISLSVSTGRMPQGMALPNAQYNAILCWISQGAPNN